MGTAPFRKGDRVRDTRYNAMATVLADVDITHRGRDGHGIAVEYDDEPGTQVATGSDYFEHATPTLNPEAQPYATYPDCPASSECDYCEEGAEYEAGHTHEVFETREGASLHTADELADIFLDAVEFYASPWRRSEDCPRDVEGWLEPTDDDVYAGSAEALQDCITLGESALADVGLWVSWNDGYVIERVVESDNATEKG